MSIHPRHRSTYLAIAALAVAALVPATAARAEQPARHGKKTLRDPASIEICMLPLGKYDKRLLTYSANGIRYLYGFTVRILEARAMPKSAYYAPRKRYRADKLLDYISDNVVPKHECFAIMGFTKHDISTTKGKYVDWGILGLGLIGGPSGVVSSYRTRRGRASRRLSAQRTVKVVNHELGHVLGLDHYDDEAGCVMNDAKGTVKTVDKEKGILCAPSREYIEKTHGIRLPEFERFDWSQVLRR